MGMDVERPDLKKKRRQRRILYGVLTTAALILITLGISSLEPAAMSVSRQSVWLGKVQRGTMVRQVRGPGTLVPKEIRWITSSVDGRVDNRLLEPGVEVEPDTVILELTNPEVEQQVEEARLAIHAAEAGLTSLRVQLENNLLNQQAQAAAVQSDYNEASLQVEANEELAKDGLVPEIDLKSSRIRAEQLQRRMEIERQRLAKAEESIESQLATARAELDQARALFALRRQQAESLTVRAGISGVLQQVPVEVGERVAAGTVLARVARPGDLKAELRIAETQAKDIEIGLPAVIDTRNGVIQGHVSRIDPAVREGTVLVDVEMAEALPPGARPDLSVDGTIQIERLDDVLYVKRPTYGQANSRVELFKLIEDGDLAVRVPVQLGRASVDTIEILEGLEEG
ncbi:MAG TPA: HlyD family efflux transporter periplasmic adaptor subunit, partial [Thermoanaerobaculia bacterium]|nr:HlyD family efflux transporter periplasmic adaptor subunit [Thermoanaerobaculia bacterium]